MAKTTTVNCDLCNVTFESKRELKNHMAEEKREQVRKDFAKAAWPALVYRDGFSRYSTLEKLTDGGLDKRTMWQLDRLCDQMKRAEDEMRQELRHIQGRAQRCLDELAVRGGHGWEEMRSSSFVDYAKAQATCKALSGVLGSMTDALQVRVDVAMEPYTWAFLEHLSNWKFTARPEGNAVEAEHVFLADANVCDDNFIDDGMDAAMARAREKSLAMAKEMFAGK